jgi:hypothetical protein
MLVVPAVAAPVVVISAVVVITPAPRAEGFACLSKSRPCLGLPSCRCAWFWLADGKALSPIPLA